MFKEGESIKKLKTLVLIDNINEQKFHIPLINMTEER